MIFLTFELRSPNTTTSSFNFIIIGQLRMIQNFLIFIEMPVLIDQQNIFVISSPFRKRRLDQCLIIYFFKLLKYQIYFNNNQIPYNSMQFSRLLILITISSIAYSQNCLGKYEYSSPMTGLCMPCPYSCETCFDQSFCISCVQQYYPSNNQCLPCPFGCSVCQNSFSCVTCIDELYLNGNSQCEACPLGAKSCTIAIVQSCKSGYFLLGSICAGCFENCDTCQDFVTCILCNEGFFVSSNGTSCLRCSNNCSVCQNQNTCTSCMQGFVLDGGVCSLPLCTNISPFCTKCSNGLCQECTFGKYLNQAGSCSQGSSLLCLSSNGPYHTNCQTNLYGCPTYAQVKYDSDSGSQLPVCLPLRSSQNKQYIYFSIMDGVCSATTALNCNSPFQQSFNFKTQKSFFKLKYLISLKIFSISTQLISVSIWKTNKNTSVISESRAIDISQQMLDNLKDSNCFDCIYGTIILSGQFVVSSNNDQNLLKIVSSKSLFKVSQVLIQTDICKVSKCSACTNSVDCVECEQPYYLQLISCLQECDPGFYTYGRTCLIKCPSDTYPIRSSYECKKCQSPCLTCYSINQCLSCMPGFFLDGALCLQKCSKPSLFTNLTSLKCQQCPNPCTQCTININLTNSSQWSVSCSGCSVGYLLQEGNCTYLCPIGTFSNYFNNKTQCSLCNSSCTSCSISENICLSCVQNYLLDESTCNFNYTCPLGYYANPLFNSCQKCHFPCQTCQVISTNCTTCIKGALYNNTCASKCPSGMFIIYYQNSQFCNNCMPPCLECISLTECLSCINTTFLYNMKCLATCPAQYYGQVQNKKCVKCKPPCLQCIDINNCLSCVTGYVDLSTHRCTLQCSITSYPDSNFTCQQCLAPCNRCYSPTSCSRCILPFVLFNQSCITQSSCVSLNKYVRYKINFYDPLLNIQSGQCASCTFPCSSCFKSPIVCMSCVADYYFVNDLAICVQQCPQSYFLNSNHTLCQKCSLNCLSCFSASDNCTACGTSMYLFNPNSSCMQNCPTGYYGSNQDQSCKVCLAPCLECYNAYLCKSCIIGILYLKTCVQVCPSGSLHNFTTNVCDQCTNNCLACSLVPQNCTQCPSNGFYFYQYQCLVSCPKKLYADQLTHNCQSCIQPCFQCISSLKCLSCLPDFYFLSSTNRCLTTCPESYYADDLTSSCLACNLTLCRTCYGALNNCTTCANGFYYDFVDNICVKDCRLGTYPDDFFLQCRDCLFPCLSCNATICFSCLSTYKIYNGFCYSSCPNGFYSENGTCSKCKNLCEICTGFQTCVKCISGYFVNNLSKCVLQCQIGWYGSNDPLTSYPICFSCSTQCSKCTSLYNCTICQNSYYNFNGLCVQDCPPLFFNDISSLSLAKCTACSKFCNKCTSTSNCLQCINSYEYKGYCYPQCPAKTFTYNEEICVDCSSPCSNCTSTYSCLSCVDGYFYFQNFCMQKCPDDVWKYPETMECKSDCNFNKYVQKKQCYQIGCGGLFVQLNGYCLEQCPEGYYVDLNQNCRQCSTNPQYCKKLFSGQMAFLRSYNLKICITFNQLIKEEEVQISKISVTFYQKKNRSQVQYQIYSIKIEEDRVVLQFQYNSISLYSVQVKLPYVRSKQMDQSLYYNVFKGELFVYNNYQYEVLSLSSKPNSLRSSSETSINFNVTYSPSKFLNIMGISVVSLTFVCMVINVITKGTHYRQLLDFIQFVSMTLYLQIQYPPILQSFLTNLRISLFSFLPQLQIGRPYSYSASKFIQYHLDSSFLRSNGILFIIFVTILLIFAIVLIINRYKSPMLDTVIKRIKYRNITDIFSIFCLPLLMFGFNFTNSKIADIVGQIVLILVYAVFIIFISYFLMTVKNLEQISGLAGELEATKNSLGQMYTPFSFIRKVIFTLVLCIQPYKPISTLTLLLIFTVLIMVCLAFYQPFQNNITDYVCISMQVLLVLYSILLILFGLNAVNQLSGHYVGIACIAFVLTGSAVGLVWLIYLTIGGIKKYKKERQEDAQKESNKNPLNQGLNTGQVNEGEQHNSENANEISQVNKSKQENDRREQEQQSAHQLIVEKKKRNSNIRYSGSHSIRKSGLVSEMGEIEIESSIGGEEFRHWKVEDSENSSDNKGQDQPPKYLLKVQKVNSININKQD